VSFVRDRYDNGTTRTAKSLVDPPGNFCSKKLELLFFPHRSTDCAESWYGRCWWQGEIRGCGRPCDLW